MGSWMKLPGLYDRLLYQEWGATRLLLASRQRLAQPTGHDGGDLPVVLFEHHHVTVATEARIGKLDPCRLDAGLLQ